MHLFRLLIAVCLLVILQAAVSEAGKRDKPKTEPRPATIVDLKLNLTPFITGGLVVGDAADLLDRYSDDATDKGFYGFGLSLSYYLNPRLALAFTVERAYKTLPGDNVDPGRGWFYSTGLIFNFRTLAREIPYARFDAGFISASYPRTGSDTDLGTHPYVRGGLGFFGYTSGSINIRFEVYYIHAFTEGSTIDDLNDYYVDFFAQFVGAELGIGIPLSRR